LVQHDAVFVNVNDYPDHVFFVEPLLRRLPETGGVTVDRDPLYQLRHGRLFLFALPKSQFAADQSLTPVDVWFEHPPEGVLKARVPLPQLEAAPMSDPRNRFESRYRIALQDGHLEVILISYDQPRYAALESGRWLIAGGLVLAALVMTLGRALVRRWGGAASR
jgi:hypothetical protein